MILEIAVGALAAGFLVLVAFLVPTLLQVRKTVAESGRLLARLNGELPPLLNEMRGMTENVNALAGQAREGVEHAAVLLHAVGELGDTVQEVHETVRGKSGNLLVNLASVVAGVKAASAVVKERIHTEKGDSNGG
ncbi:MAG: DUF948 domain-containing protein [Nitrospiraceae bacterium]